MLFFLVVAPALGAATTALIIERGQDVSYQEFLISAFVWIVAPSASYVANATSWKFTERTGFGAYGRYMLLFARNNRN